jgi:hypothetical protein
MSETRGNRNVRRVFVTQEQIDRIIELHKEGKSTREISRETGVNERNVRQKKKEKRRDQTNEWTDEEDALLRYHYYDGIIKVPDLCKILTKKAYWMIRNRIKLINRPLPIPSPYKIDPNPPIKLDSKDEDDEFSRWCLEDEDYFNEFFMF